MLASQGRKNGTCNDPEVLRRRRSYGNKGEDEETQFVGEIMAEGWQSVKSMLQSVNVPVDQVAHSRLTITFTGKAEPGPEYWFIRTL